MTEVALVRGAVADPGRAGIVPPECVGSPVYVFTDQTVHRLSGEVFVQRLAALGHDVHPMIMADGEGSKTLSHYAYLAERVLARGIDERSVLISLGGGAVCNVCGLLAATLYRGVTLVHVPTTLMAQADAAISHKQGINAARGKNLVGAYHAPRRVVVDIDVLATLDDRLVTDGLAEVLKHALAQDEAYLDELLLYDGSPRAPRFLERVVRRNIELKCALMARDPQERVEGMVLQYGHAIGHAVEVLSDFRLYHGESVAIGMMASAWVAHELGVADPRVVETHRLLLERYGLPTCLPDDQRVDEVIAHMRQDKRCLARTSRRGDEHRLALVASPGELWVAGGESAVPVSPEVLARGLARCRRPPPAPRQPRWPVTLGSG